MNLVQTTLGALAAEALGRVNAHDHVIIDGGLTVIKEPDFRLDDVPRAIEELGRWRLAGGGAVIDTMPFGCGRNVRKLIEVSRGARVPIVVATGFQMASYYLPDHWQHRYDAETISELLIAECAEGVDENNYDGPIVVRSDVKAGVIKVAGGYQVLSPTTHTLIRAAGRAHAATGVPVLVHTERGTAGHLLLDALEEAGVSPDRVMLCHVDRNPDLRLHESLAERGAYLEYDTPGRIKYQPESVVIRLMRDVIEAGYGDRILLGGDMARRSYWTAYGGGPGFDYLLSTFTPRLRHEGFSDEIIETIWRANPARWLTGRDRASAATAPAAPDDRREDAR